MSMGNRPSFSREPKLQWAGSRERNLASVRGRTFFLTSLFIELIEGPAVWVVSAAGRHISAGLISGGQVNPYNSVGRAQSSLAASLDALRKR
jgi:hypothetical protein